MRGREEASWWLEGSGEWCRWRLQCMAECCVVDWCQLGYDYVPAVGVEILCEQCKCNAQ